MLKKVLNFALVAGLAATTATTTFAQDADKIGYAGAPRTMLWSTSPATIMDTTQYKKDGPYVIGFSNASISNNWRVGMLHSIQQAAHDNADQIKQLIITDANDDPAKQVSDVQDLISRGVDLLIVSAATAEALDAIVTRAYESRIRGPLRPRRAFASFLPFGHLSVHRRRAGCTQGPDVQRSARGKRCPLGQTPVPTGSFSYDKNPAPA